MGVPSGGFFMFTASRFTKEVFCFFTFCCWQYYIIIADRKENLLIKVCSA